MQKVSTKYYDIEFNTTHLKMIIHYDQGELIPGMQGWGSTYENLSMQYSTLRK